MKNNYNIHNKSQKTIISQIFNTAYKNRTLLFVINILGN